MLGELQAQIRGAKNVLCLMDQDGTTADFHDEPMKAFVKPKLVELIRDTYQGSLQQRKTIYAIVTGRPFDEAKVLNVLPDKSLLFDQVNINGVFNHGQEMYIDGKLVELEGFSYTPAQQAFMEEKLLVAQKMMRKFFDKHLTSKGYLLSEDRKGNIYISKQGEAGQEIKYQLIEAKYLSNGNLSSFAIHSRFLTTEKELESVIKAAVGEFRAEHINTQKNQGLITDKNKDIFGELHTAGAAFFHLPEAHTSAMVDEVAGPYSKAHTVKLFIEQLEARGCRLEFILSAGDSAAVGGTDRGMLEAVANLNGKDGLTTAVVQVRHHGNGKPFLVGPNMYEVKLSEPKKVAEMEEFLLGCGFTSELRMTGAPHAILLGCGAVSAGGDAAPAKLLRAYRQ